MGGSQRAHDTEPPEREDVPVAGNAERPVPNAPRTVPRGSEGQ